MTIEIAEFDHGDRDEWDTYVERSSQASFFHQYEALRLQAKHSNSTLHLLVGFKTEEPVGLFPVFEIRKGLVKTAFSPPPHIGVPYLGPVMLDAGNIKSRKFERRRNQFIDGCTAWIDEHIGPNYTHVRVGDYYTDMRTFLWGGCDVSPKYTYNVDLTRDENELLMSFSRSARRNIRDGRKLVSDIEEGDRDDICSILTLVKDRYEEQDLSFDVPPQFVMDLYDSLPAGQIRPYVFRYDGTFVSGILALQYGDTLYRWLGGVRPQRDFGIDVNDLLDWRIMRDGMDAGMRRYDLVGANNHRLNRYKSKYNPELVTFYQIEHGALPVRTIAHLYKSRLGPGIEMLSRGNGTSLSSRLVSGLFHR
ncbi:GNAT family N-acetyltransferase [Haloferax sp. KTX1]|uniref:lipid II:glycine glycyltransferase FemX n=1 Tax=Haloferax sp. KTX1 TaxID=2600597 RepID=UPI0011DCD6C2|nr:GNAT family N-acetyltransferase [Haloferax sp. KTX1]